MRRLMRTEIGGFLYGVEILKCTIHSHLARHGDISLILGCSHQVRYIQAYVHTRPHLEEAA